MIFGINIMTVNFKMKYISTVLGMVKLLRVLNSNVHVSSNNESEMSFMRDKSFQTFWENALDDLTSWSLLLY